MTNVIPQASTTAAAPTAKQAVRVGAVSYTNTAPLVDGLDDPELQRAQGFSLTLDTPAALADDLGAGRLDVALISVAEFLRGDYLIVRAGCIGCQGPVLSVRLFSPVEIERVERIALDPASRSANVLARVLAKHLWRIDPEFVAVTQTSNATESCPDSSRDPKTARLLIGDPALRALGSAEHEYDLGAAWQELTQLPFVFAVWAARPAANLGAIPALLEEARLRGLDSLEQHARAAAARLGISAQIAREYLHRHIQTTLGDQQLVAIEMFYRLARDLDLVPENEKPRFWGA